jgi:DNA-binding CsgD family transcriptional regulator
MKRQAPEVSLELTKTHLILRIPIEAKLVPIAERIRDGAGEPPYLSPRQREVFEGVRKGRQNKEIASDLNITERTVKFHITDVLKRTGLTSRTEILKRFGYAVILFLAILAPTRAQDQTSKTFNVLVGHVVHLNWNASTSTVAGYNIYSASVSGGPYNKIGSSTTLTYSDMTAISGNTYYYVVTAVDSSGNESVYSNEASVVVPTP